MAPRMSTTRLLALFTVGATLTHADSINVDSADSIKNAASTLAYGLMSSYRNNQTSTSSSNVGLFGEPYYWWTAGAAWGSMVSYWALTGDTSYNPTVSQALLAQTGSNFDYMPPAQTKDEGNDDQAFWALACMDALELGFPNPPADRPQWLQLAVNTWNLQRARWNTNTCGGGLRWQIFAFNNGYQYKNTISTGNFLQLSARLARYTGNQTYTTWAEMSWTWLSDIGLIDADYNVFDGTDVDKNCSDRNHMLWTHNYGSLLYGAAVLYNSSNGSLVWRERVDKLTKAALRNFFVDSGSGLILTEAACESQGNCNIDQVAFKGIFARWLARSTLMAPFLREQVYLPLRATTISAVGSCRADFDKPLSCDYSWLDPLQFARTTTSAGVSEKLSVLDTIQSLLVLNTTVTLRRQGDAPASSNSTGSGSSSSSGSGSGSGSNSTSGGTGSQTSNGTTGGGTGAANSLIEGSNLMHLATAILFGLVAQSLL